METYTINYSPRAAVTLAASYCRFNFLGGLAVNGSAWESGLGGGGAAREEKKQKKVESWQQLPGRSLFSVELDI